MAEAIHDGPVQDLIGLDMILSAANQAAAAGEAEKAAGLVDQARDLASRNVFVLRDEIVDLGPYAFEELSYSAALENCLDVWKRRYGFEVLVTIEALELPRRPPATSSASPRRPWPTPAATPTPRRCRSRCDGGPRGGAARDRQRPGLRERQPAGCQEPGHLGVASMRERAELMRGSLEIETSDRGTRRLSSAPSTRLSASTRTGMPLRNAIPASASRSSGSLLASRFTFAPPCSLASCQPPRWPQPCGRATVPGVISSVTLTPTTSAPDLDSSLASPPSSIPCSSASSGWIRSEWVAAAAHQQRGVVHPGVVRAQLAHPDQPERVARIVAVHGRQALDLGGDLGGRRGTRRSPCLTFFRRTPVRT